MSVRYPVEKNFHANLWLRQKLIREAAGDVQLQQDLMDICREDIHFFFHHFVTLYEPRNEMKELPFIVWPHQVEVIDAMQQAIREGEDFGLEKSRGEGASWMSILVFFHSWLFSEDQVKFTIVTRNEETVDARDDMDALMPKLDFVLDRLPGWMAPPFTRSHSKHSLLNHNTKSTIIGYSTTGDVASGGRATAMLLDELSKFPRGQDYEAMASTQHVTNSRFLVSTYKGNSGAFFEAMNGDSSMIRKTLTWEDNPTRNRGLYTVEGGQLVENDPSNPLPDGYRERAKDLLPRLANRGYQIGDKVRSPWYDKQCLRVGATPSNIAEELDRDPTRAGSSYFDPEMMDRLLRDCVNPMHEGDFIYSQTDGQTTPSRFKQRKGGAFRLWGPLLTNGALDPDTDYVIGVDIAAGGGGVQASNSALCVASIKTRQKVAAFASPAMMPHEFARLCYYVGHWLKGHSGPALIIHESNGPTGAQFGRTILEMGYPNLYRRKDETKMYGKTQAKVGLHNQGETRGLLYGGYGDALSRGDFVNLDRQCLGELKFYQHAPGGGIVHVSEANTKDPSGASHNHGDRATSAALANWGLKSYPENKKKVKVTSEVPVGSFQWRRDEAKNAKKEKTYW